MLTQYKFPIIYSDAYQQSILKVEKISKLNTKMSSKTYKYLEEEEILDSKEEEELWYEEMADKIKEDEAKREQEMRAQEEDNDPEEGKKGKNKDKNMKLPLDRQKTIHKYTEANPEGSKNFFHEPDSPSRAFLLEHMSTWYLLKL